MSKDKEPRFVDPEVRLRWNEDPFVMYLLIVVLPLVLLVASFVLGMWWVP